MSTFLTETDLAGLKVCSGSSSPSIVSVQSDRGASCNSKLSQQSPPGPALKSQRAHRLVPAEHAAETAGAVGTAVPSATCKHEHRTGPRLADFRKAVTITCPAVVGEVSEVTTYTITFHVPRGTSLLSKGK